MRRQKQKRPWETRKPPMALILNSTGYSSTGQTSLSMFAQRHQLHFFVRKITATLILFSAISLLFNRFPKACQVFLGVFLTPQLRCKIQRRSRDINPCGIKSKVSSSSSRKGSPNLRSCYPLQGDSTGYRRQGY